MPAEKRPLFDVFPDQDHHRHIQTIDMFISSFLDMGEAMEIPMENKDTPSVNGGTMGDPAVKRLVQSMSTEQKQELIANLLRHRSMHLAYMYGQLNHAMDQFGNPTGVPNETTGQGPNAELAGSPGNDPNLESIMQLVHSVPELANMQPGQG